MSGATVIVGDTQPRWARSASQPVNPMIVGPAAPIPAAAEPTPEGLTGGIPSARDPGPRRHVRVRHVRCVETDEVMTLDAAAERTGLKAHTIAQACTPSGMKLKWGGFHWRWERGVAVPAVPAGG